MSAAVVTLGCRMNLAESEAIRAGLGDRQELVVVNSCAVTAEAVAQSRRALRRARRDRPQARIIVTGCASQIDPAGFAPLADAIVPNAAKLDLARYLAAPGADRSADGVAPGRTAAARQAHARAFIPVQNGCDHRCTFCIIPQGRGASRSYPIDRVVREIERALAGGAREAVLTGVDLTSWGADLPGRPGLADLVAAILRRLPGLPRLRFSSLDPAAIDPALVALIAGEPRIMPHVHLSLQAGDDMILKRMRRRHSRGQAIAAVRRLRALRPEIAIGADLIAGFPTESAAMFGNSLALIEECEIVLPHIFPYSPRAGTPAARMPQLEREVIRARAGLLRDAGTVQRRRWLAGHVGTVQHALIELDGVSGHAEDFAAVRLAPGHAAPANTIVPVRITAVADDGLIAVPA